MNESMELPPPATPERITILEGFLRFRQKLNEEGIINGVQWLDGSFIIDIEKLENRPPHDLDIVTFIWGINESKLLREVSLNFPEILNPQLSKKNYFIDHYIVPIDFSPQIAIQRMGYWYNLFSHTRDKVWKGILQLPINTHEIDQLAIEFLKERRGI